MKGQLTVEFLILVSVLVIMFTVFTFSEASLRERTSYIKSSEETEELCENIAFEINSAVKFGDSYKRNFHVEEEIFGVSDFQISISDYAVFIDWDGRSTTCTILIKNIIGDVKKGWNLIENMNGIIYVS
jgi:hypothetical protein